MTRFTHMKSFFQNLRRNQKGATAIEYTLIAAGISVVIVGAIALIGTSVNNMFNNVINGM